MSVSIYAMIKMINTTDGGDYVLFALLIIL